MERVTNRPIVLVAVCWIVGYAAAFAWAFPLLGWRTAILAGLGCALAGLAKLPGRHWLMPLLLAVAAASYYEACDRSNATALPDLSNGTEAKVRGWIDSAVEVDGDKVSFVLLADSVAAMEEGQQLQRGAREKLQVSIRLVEQQEQAVAMGWGRGDRVELSGTLKRPEPARNFGGFDYRAYLTLHHIHWLLQAKGLAAVHTGVNDESLHNATFLSEPMMRLSRWNDELRSLLAAKFDELFDEEQAGYMKSLVLGVTEFMNPDRFQQFSRLGLTHVLAISGLHVAIFVGGCLGLMRICGLTRERALTAAMVLVPVYTALAGGSPSVVRAGLMAMLALYAARRGILKDGLHLLCAVALLMLLWEPYYLLDVSFQLSFLVTAGLILGVPRFSRLLPIRSPALNSAVSVTTVAQLVSFPVSIYYFNTLSLLSWAANFLLVPFISFVTLPLGSIALPFALVWQPAGEWIAWLADGSNRLTFWLVDKGASSLTAQTIWPTPSLWWVAVYFLGLAALYATWMWHLQSARSRLWPVTAAGLAMAVLLTAAYSPVKSSYSPSGSVSFLDVGQGDAILIRTPQGRTVLIDGGGTISFRKPGEEWKERRDPFELGKDLLVPLLKKRGIHAIDFLVVSHQDADHIGGLQAVLETIPVRRLLFNDSWKGNASSKQLFETALRQGTELLGGKWGDEVQVDARTKLTVLHPLNQQPEAGSELPVEEDQNGASLVLLMRMYDSRFLFTGDMGEDQEHSILEAIQQQSPDHDVEVDVLKIAHHGSKTSTSEEWLAYWHPERTVISVGVNNVYGHPSPLVLDRIKKAGLDPLRTDLHGEVAMIVTKGGIRVSTKFPYPT
ncbi:DNA internalization-related competence protein ComEC/Rec2 [Paenibacillus koleovorans]|uniref:DNA internalization-related competence protein ComEC/Rec2 n=1 Tax=Paenibacillus koleovorans TaxID=121608 RepID=UPI000FD9DD3C|nr:DNA internalization-related competence protein ComEC/Rec2 [Paenibacillus koleovorans]